jgi:hypothetical protein
VTPCLHPCRPPPVRAECRRAAARQWPEAGGVVRGLVACVWLLWWVGVAGSVLSAQAPVTSRDAPRSPLADGTPLRGDQFPRFLKPTHQGEFGFDDFVVLGSHLTIQFERPATGFDAETIVETWNRLGTTTVGGRSASVFRMVWPAATLADAYRRQRWGVDRSLLWWGQVVVETAGAEQRRDIYLQLTPTNIPASTVVLVNESVQYTSHAVNIWVPDYGESLAEGGATAFELATVSQRFYEQFADQYDTLAIVSQTAFLTDPIGFRHVVSNNIAGLGLPRFDVSADFGSEGVLRGIEAYPPGEWASQRAALHQQEHQWSDYSAVWNGLSVDRAGDAPDQHTPLITPGEVVTGAVLDGATRVVSDDVEGFVIALSTPTVTYHPWTLYRMGLIPPSDVPDLRVFVDQAQFAPDERSSPPVGTPVVGPSQPVFVQDVIAADGSRSGPSVERVRRAVVYVTRAGLASQEEMDVVTFYAARVAARQGVTSWDGYPSFFEATGERATMSTTVVPRPGVGAGPVEDEPAVSHLNVATDALHGLLLDKEIPGRIDVGAPLVVSGIVTAADRDDFTFACLRFLRYGALDANEAFVCSSLAGSRFSVELTFSVEQRGRYTVEPFLFWPGAAGQVARSRYGVITVE